MVRIIFGVELGLSYDFQSKINQRGDILTHMSFWENRFILNTAAMSADLRLKEDGTVMCIPLLWIVVFIAVPSV